MRKNGYTFVEILVVVTIIALIAGISAVSYNSTNKNARDARRLSDVETIRSALELFRSELGYYPDLSDVDGHCITATEIVDDSTPPVVYLNLIPKDPSDINSPRLESDPCYTYSLGNPAVTYQITYKTEKDGLIHSVKNP